jgi:hypothetical protein
VRAGAASPTGSSAKLVVGIERGYALRNVMPDAAGAGGTVAAADKILPIALPISWSEADRPSARVG